MHYAQEDVAPEYRPLVVLKRRTWPSLFPFGRGSRELIWPQVLYVTISIELVKSHPVWSQDECKSVE